MLVRSAAAPLEEGPAETSAREWTTKIVLEGNKLQVCITDN